MFTEFGSTVILWAVCFSVFFHVCAYAEFFLDRLENELELYLIQYLPAAGGNFWGFMILNFNFACNFSIFEDVFYFCLRFTSANKWSFSLLVCTYAEFTAYVCGKKKRCSRHCLAESRVLGSYEHIAVINLSQLSPALAEVQDLIGALWRVESPREAF